MASTPTDWNATGSVDPPAQAFDNVRMRVTNLSYATNTATFRVAMRNGNNRVSDTTLTMTDPAFTTIFGPTQAQVVTWVNTQIGAV